MKRGFRIAVLAMACLEIAGFARAESGRVGLWDRFEATVANPRSYADPFRDVTLDIVWTRPDGSKVSFWGFYDGGRNWRLRFMPDQLGAWKYEATFSDGAEGADGSFDCVPSELPGMVSVYEPNPIWFGYRGGGPLLLRSLHIGDRFFGRNWDAAATGRLPWTGRYRQPRREAATVKQANTQADVEPFLLSKVI